MGFLCFSAIITLNCKNLNKSLGAKDLQISWKMIKIKGVEELYLHYLKIKLTSRK